MLHIVVVTKLYVRLDASKLTSYTATLMKQIYKHDIDRKTTRSYLWSG